MASLCVWIKQCFYTFSSQHYFFFRTGIFYFKHSLIYGRELKRYPSYLLSTLGSKPDWDSVNMEEYQNGGLTWAYFDSQNVFSSKLFLACRSQFLCKTIVIQPHILYMNKITILQCYNYINPPYRTGNIFDWYTLKPTLIISDIQKWIDNRDVYTPNTNLFIVLHS